MISYCPQARYAGDLPGQWAGSDIHGMRFATPEEAQASFACIMREDLIETRVIESLRKPNFVMRAGEPYSLPKVRGCGAMAAGGGTGNENKSPTSLDMDCD